MLKEIYDFNDLVNIMRVLRSSNGCPWDLAQDHRSLKRYLIEETYEVLETIDMQDSKKLCDELGDLLLQIIFHSKIAEDNDEFSIQDVITGICKKMISRHVHVFGSEEAKTPDEVIGKWDDVKKKEKGIVLQTDVLKAISINLPALIRSYKIQEKAARVGFDWDKIEQVFEKVEEEVKELKEVYQTNHEERISEELGDLIFSIVNLSRFLSIQPELALTKTINKFIRRFEYVELKSIEQATKLEDMTLVEMDALWNEAKKLESK